MMPQRQRKRDRKQLRADINKLSRELHKILTTNKDQKK